MILYLDVIWALNFLFDSLLLYLTAIVLKRTVKLWKVFLGGFAGSLIIVLMFSPFNSYTGHPLAKLIFSMVMVFIVFGYKRLSYYLNGLFAFYLVTFLIGGGLIGVHYLLQFDSAFSRSLLPGTVHGFGDPVSWLFVILGFPAAWHFSKRSLEKMEMTKITYEELVDVFIKISTTELQCRGLVDSGNQLYDPVTKVPVMIVTLIKQQGTVPEALGEAAANPEKILRGEADLPEEWKHKIRVIPYKVVGQEHQLLLAVKPDEIIIKKQNESIQVKKGLVSFTLQRLSSDDLFQCIVHPKMITGQKKPDVG